MICRIGSVVRSGPAVGIEQSLSAEPLLRAIRSTEPIALGARTLAVDCEPLTDVYEYVGHVHPEMGLRTRTALAAAGRTRAQQTPYDDEIDRVESELASVRAENCGLEARRRERADEHNRLRQIRETVAMTRGRLAACRDHGLETDELETALQEQIQRLAEAETTTTAAAQSHQQAREQARAARDRRERAFKLEERLENLRREARNWLVGELEAEFTSAVRELSASVDDPFSSRPAVAGVAIARLAEYTAPLVLDAELFESASAAHEYVGGPVIQL